MMEIHLRTAHLKFRGASIWVSYLETNPLEVAIEPSILISTRRLHGQSKTPIESMRNLIYQVEALIAAYQDDELSLQAISKIMGISEAEVMCLVTGYSDYKMPEKVQKDGNS